MSKRIQDTLLEAGKHVREAIRFSSSDIGATEADKKELQEIENKLVRIRARIFTAAYRNVKTKEEEDLLFGKLYPEYKMDYHTITQCVVCGGPMKSGCFEEKICTGNNQDCYHTFRFDRVGTYVISYREYYIFSRAVGTPEEEHILCKNGFIHPLKASKTSFPVFQLDRNAEEFFKNLLADQKY